MGSRSKMMSSRPKNGTPPTGKRRPPAKTGGRPIVSEVSRKAIRRERLRVLKKVLGYVPKSIKRFKVRIFDNTEVVFYRGNEI